MKKKHRNIFISVLFCTAILAVPALFFLQPKKSFSEREKRYLAEAPELTSQSLRSGSFTEQLGSYVADHFPGRELFVGINAYFDLLSGRQETKEYFSALGGRLFARPVDTDLRILNSNLDSINAFARDLASTEADIPLSLMLVPSSGAVLLDRQDYPDGAIISYAYERAQTGEVDLLGAFRSFSDPEKLYYRTDHHWTSEGAFQAACVYRRSLGLPCPSREEYTQQSYGPFYGSAYAGSGLWLSAPDSLDLWYSGKLIQVSNETGHANNGVFYMERLQEQDKYTVFLDGNHSLVRIENLSGGIGAERNLLVIRDSFSNSLGCFLADLYDKVILVDLRYYKLPLTELIVDEDIDEILIEYSVDNFLHDTNLAFLSMDPEPLRQKVEEERRPPNYYAPPQKLTDDFFDGAYYLGDSVDGILSYYCLHNGKLRNTTIASNAMLGYDELAQQVRKHLVYKGNFATLPELLEAEDPKMLIVALGCNDLARADVEPTTEAVAEFLNLVRETSPDTTVFIQSVMPIRVNLDIFNQGEVDGLNTWLKEHAETYDYCYIELGQYFKDEKGQMAASYSYNDTHLKPSAAPIWYQQLMNGGNYYHFPEQYYVEYDGVTNQQLEKAVAAIEEAEPDAVEEEPQKETVLDQIYARICEQIPCPEMLELNERTISSYLGLNPEDFRDGRFYLCANNLKADEIWLVELENEDAVQKMMDKARERIQVKASSYELYLPEESEIARRGVAVAKGNYLALFLSPDAERMRDIFLAALDD